MHPTRRDILSLAAASLGAISLPGCKSTPSQPARFIGYIDAHSHVWTPDTKRFPLGPWITPDKMDPASFTADQLLAVAQPAGVDRVVLIQHAPYYGDDNAYLIDCAAKHAGRFSIVAIVDERRADLADHLRRLKRQGVRGLRIGPSRYADRTLVKEPMNWLKAPPMRKLWSIATDEGLVLCPLISADFIPTLEPTLKEFAKTTVAIDHFAHATTDDDMTALRRLAEFPSVHVKVSGFYKFGDQKAPYDDVSPMIKSVLDGFGSRRLLWGSDCPYQLQNGNNYTDAVRLIERLDFLSPLDRTAILRENSERLFFT